jgi:hypothetical protein
MGSRRTTKSSRSFGLHSVRAKIRTKPSEENSQENGLMAQEKEIANVPTSVGFIQLNGGEADELR